MVEETPVDDERSAPKKQVTIVDCGELTGDQKLSADQCDYLKIYDEAPVISKYAQEVLDDREKKLAADAELEAKKKELAELQAKNAEMQAKNEAAEEEKTEEVVEEVDTANAEEIDVNAAD